MEKENDLYEELMIRVLDGYATAEEKNKLKKWVAESPIHQKTYSDFQKIWTATPDAKLLEQLEVDKDLMAVKAKAAKGTASQSAIVRSLSIWRKVAAILLPLAIVTSALLFFTNPKDPTAPLLLGDGTKVWLYKDANLSFPKTFEGNTRLVQLKGEAYFEVAEDATKPFIIAAGGATIQVLGTSFNVQSSTSNIEVIVNSGKVKLAATANPEQAVELTKGEKGIYANAQVQESTNTDKNYRAWHTGVFEFDGSISIEETIRQLSKYYGPITLNTVANKDCLLEATFNKEELSTVLEIISSTCGY